MSDTVLYVHTNVLVPLYIAVPVHRAIMAIQPTDLPASDDSAPRTALLENLTRQSALLDQLFSTLASGHSAGPSDGQAGLSQTYASLHSTVQSFAGIIDDVYEHQAAYEVMLDKQTEAERLERQVRDALVQLEQDRAEMESIVLEGQQVRKAIERSEAGRSMPRCGSWSSPRHA